MIVYYSVFNKRLFRLTTIRPTYLVKCLKFFKALYEAEELQTDARGNDQQTHGEKDEAA